MIEPKLATSPSGRAQIHGGGDEVGIETGIGRGLDDLFEVFARGRLAAGQMNLQDTHLARLAHDRAPFLGGELILHAFELDGVRAIRALKRTAMGEFGEETDRRQGAQFGGFVLAADDAGGRLVVDGDSVDMSVNLEILGHVSSLSLDISLVGQVLEQVDHV